MPDIQDGVRPAVAFAGPPSVEAVVEESMRVEEGEAERESEDLPQRGPRTPARGRGQLGGWGMLKTRAPARAGAQTPARGRGQLGGWGT